MADVAFALLNFCTIANIDLAHVLERKIEKNAKKYPIEHAKGRREKYQRYQEMREKNKEKE